MYGYSIGTASENDRKTPGRNCKKQKIGGRTDEKSSQDQEKKNRRVGEKIHNGRWFFAEMNTNKSEDAQNFGVDHAFVKGIDSTKHALIEQVMHFSRPKRTITSGKDTVYTLITNWE